MVRAGILLRYGFFFFFSSRRRHTRSDRDWSSDVCSSDLFWNDVTRPVANVTLKATPALITRQRQNLGRTRSRGFEVEADARLNSFWKLKIGRASCRERV